MSLAYQSDHEHAVMAFWSLGRPIDSSVSPVILAFDVVILTPAGVEVIADHWRSPGLGQALVFAPLSPSDVLSATVDLRDGYSFSETGTYVLNARYTGEPTADVGSEAWQRQRLSAPVTIDVSP